MTESIGVIVARFQVHNLHVGHRYTVEYVLERHQEVLVILGVSYSSTDRNPLSFEMRKGMLESLYPGRLTIVPSTSSPSSIETRSQMIDVLIRKTFPNRDAVVYGARDSFIHNYSGIFPVREVPTVYSGSATQVRESVGVINSPDFRAGVVYSHVHRKVGIHSAVDVAILGPQGILLVGKKNEEGRLRFPGVFFNPDEDDSFEQAGIRCVQKEIPTIRFADSLKFVASQRISDWRFKKTRESVVSLLMKTHYINGDPHPGVGVDSVEWVPLSECGNRLIESHIPLLNLLKQNI